MLRRTHIVLAVTALLAIVALAAVRVSVGRAVASREAQLTLAALKTEVTELQSIPWMAGLMSTEPPSARVAAVRRRIDRDLAALERSRPVPALDVVRRELRANAAAFDAVERVAAENRTGSGASPLAARQRATELAANAALDRAARQYAARAHGQQLHARAVSTSSILLLLVAFGFFFQRSGRAAARSRALAEENARLAAASRLEALTDALTGLPNRRALMADLALHLPREEHDDLALVLLDLDGFKAFNDRFGHLEGDALLARLGTALADALDGVGTAYRLGGDEFCVVAPLDGRDHASVAMRAALALSETGDEHEIGASLGVALVPAEANEVEAALRLADARLYEDKSRGVRPYELNSRR